VLRANKRDGERAFLGRYAVRCCVGPHGAFATGDGIREVVSPESVAGSVSVRMEPMGRQRREDHSFADRASTARSPGVVGRANAQPWPQPIRAGHWIDDSGTDWHLRGGGGLTHPVLRRLLKRPDLRILHAYGVRPREVSGAERAALLARVERYLAGEAPPRSEFRLAEFRDDDRHVMLVIEEDC
jgi:hypothetical protein